MTEIVKCQTRIFTAGSTQQKSCPVTRSGQKVWTWCQICGVKAKTQRKLQTIPLQLGFRSEIYFLKCRDPATSLKHGLTQTPERRKGQLKTTWQRTAEAELNNMKYIWGTIKKKGWAKTVRSGAILLLSCKTPQGELASYCLADH